MQVVEPSAEGTSAPVLVTGLPEPKVRRVDWRESMTNILCRDWSSRKPSAKTTEAEKALGIDGAPRYFYAVRTERAFGFAVFFFREVSGFTWPDNADGATPFDSGGLWFGKIATRPPAESHKRKEIFRKCRISLPLWRSEFDRYISANYSDLTDYIEGDPPSDGTPPIIASDLNTSRAWTWEVRVPSQLMNRGVDLYHGFLSEEDRNKYRDWLWTDSDLDDGTCRLIELWMEENMTFAPLGESALKYAEIKLLRDEV